MRDLEHLRALQVLVQSCIYSIELERPEIIDWKFFKKVAIEHIQNIAVSVEDA